MSHYENILLAVDLSEEAVQVIARVKPLQKVFGAKLNIVYVVEPLNLNYGSDIPMDVSSIQEQIQAQAKARLQMFADELNIPEDRQFLEIGRPDTEIHRVANENHCDLIVTGSHGRQGLALLLGSTVNGVLHGATCDVLAVRIDPPQERA